MTEFVLEPPPIPSLVVVDDERRFPVRRIFCVARNYADHVKEMGGDPSRTPPSFFTKPADAVVPSGATIPYPAATNTLHHEVELVVALGGGGVEIPATSARELIFGCTVGLDLTRRDIQAVAKEKKGPWDMAKGFDDSAPCGALVPLAPGLSLERGRIWMEVNGELRQEGDLGQMIWGVTEIIAQLSTLVRLAPGDLIFTGTPSGVGPLIVGDTIAAGIEGLGTLELAIA